MLDRLIAEAMQEMSGGTRASAPGAAPGGGGSPLMQIILQLLAGGASGGRQAGAGGLGGLLSGLQGGGAPGAGGGLDGLIGMILGGASQGGGQGGLGGLLTQLQQSGLGRQADSWVSPGENLPVERDDLARAFGRERLESLARQHGMDVDDVMSGLSAELPRAVDELTPQGRLPQRDELAGLFAGLGRGTA